MPLTSLQAVKKDLSEVLMKVYDEREAFFILKYYFRDKFTKKQIEDTQYLEKEIEKDIIRFSNNEPYQYIVGKAFFYNRPFYVDGRVLIPRPETEELVTLVINHIEKTDQNKFQILDIGCGSGCIGTTLKLECSKSFDVSATLLDISDEALQVARINSNIYHCDPKLLRLDFLDEQQWLHIPKSNIIVSNPPYIDKLEMMDMSPNVLNFEPSNALFADPPIVFYEAIARFAAFQKMASKIYCECNPLYIHQTIKVFEDNGCEKVEINHDLQGKQRFVTADYSPKLT